jgi:hypothetical protein
MLAGRNALPRQLPKLFYPGMIFTLVLLLSSQSRRSWFRQAPTPFDLSLARYHYYYIKVIRSLAS